MCTCVCVCVILCSCGCVLLCVCVFVCVCVCCFYQMNLASQSVLEGLNACLDHRGEVSTDNHRSAQHSYAHTM